jgi:hypothetical protein
MGFTPDGKPYIGDTEQLLAQHITGQPLTLPFDAVHPDRDTELLGEA